MGKGRRVSRVSSIMPYTTNIEKKYTREQLKAAADDYFARQKKLKPDATYQEKNKAGISQVSKDHDIGRVTLSYYVNHIREKNKNAKSKRAKSRRNRRGRT